MRFRGHRLTTWFVVLSMIGILIFGLLVLLAERRYYALAFWPIVYGLTYLGNKMMDKDHVWNITNESEEERKILEDME